MILDNLDQSCLALIQKSLNNLQIWVQYTYCIWRIHVSVHKYSRLADPEQLLGLWASLKEYLISPSFNKRLVLYWPSPAVGPQNHSWVTLRPKKQAKLLWEIQIQNVLWLNVPQGVIVINFSKSLWVGQLSDSSDTETFFGLFFYMSSVSSGHLNSVVHRLKGHLMSPQIAQILALSWLAEQ